MSERRIRGLVARMIGGIRPAILLTALSSAGCGGGPMFKAFISADPAVEWVWEAPMQLGHSMFGSGFAWSCVGPVVVADTGELVVLTNYGGSWGWLEPCNAFLLDIETGRNLRRVRGPYDTMGNWYLDGRKLYVRGTMNGEKVWCELDLETGRTTNGVSRPRGRRHGGSGSSYSGGALWLFFCREYFSRNDSQKTGRHNVGRGIEVVIHGSSIKLAFPGATGSRRERVLCRLPRIYPHDCDVVVHDDRRLVFSSGSYLICVDVRGLPRVPSTSQPSTAALDMRGNHTDSMIGRPGDPRR